jgi:ribosomal protein S13
MQEFSKLIRHAVRKELEAKGRPETIFKQVFYDVREKVKDIKKNWEQEAGEKLEKQVLDDLKSKNISVIEHKFSLGKYRGSRFVTSFKLKVQLKDEAAAKSLVEYLRKTYSPKWRVNKLSDDGVAELNLRGTDIMNKEKVAQELKEIRAIIRMAFDSDRAYRDMKKTIDNAYDTFHDYRKEAEGQINERKSKFLDKMEWALADVIDDLEKFKRMDD